MSLPQGYIELAYIQSDGSQYIDTGFKPNSNTQVTMDFYLESDNTAFMFGARATRASTYRNTFAFLWYNNSSNFRSDYNTTETNIDGTAIGRHTVDKNKNVCVIDGVSSTCTSGTFTCSYNMYLFTCNTSDAIYSPTFTGKVYSCQIYDDGTLVRDYIPCSNPDGIAGLYDLVNGVFYANSGSGVFVPGEEVHRAPDAPSGLTAAVMGTDALLSWDADEDAVGYRIYRGSELFGETDETQYPLTGLEKYTVHVYSAAAYNENGEGDQSSVSFCVDGSNRPLDDLITDRTAADVTMRRKKGSYNASDLNRVSAAAEYVRALIRALGYTLPDGNDRVWLESDIPDIPGLADHHSAVLGLDVIGYAREKLRLPGSLVHLTYTDANTIERFLLEIGEAAERIPKTYIYSGEIYGGEND